MGQSPPARGSGQRGYPALSAPPPAGPTGGRDGSSGVDEIRAALAGVSGFSARHRERSRCYAEGSLSVENGKWFVTAADGRRRWRRFCWHCPAVTRTDPRRQSGRPLSQPKVGSRKAALRQRRSPRSIPHVRHWSMCGNWTAGRRKYRLSRRESHAASSSATRASRSPWDATSSFLPRGACGTRRW